MAFNLRAFVNGHKVLVTFIVLAALLVGWWHYAFPSATWRYKMTVTIETPEGIKTGSAVREVIARKQPQVLGATSGQSIGTIGEAVTVDMGKGKYLFAIMDTDGSPNIVQNTFPYSPKSFRDFLHHYSSLKSGPVALLPPNIPTFVTFKDIKDPKTVEAVETYNLAATFGAGVKLKDVTIEMTDEPVTQEIEKYLLWLPNVQKGSLDGSEVTTGSSYANTLHVGYFKRGE